MDLDFNWMLDWRLRRKHNSPLDFDTSLERTVTRHDDVRATPTGAMPTWDGSPMADGDFLHGSLAFFAPWANGQHWILPCVRPSNGHRNDSFQPISFQRLPLAKEWPLDPPLIN